MQTAPPRQLLGAIGSVHGRPRGIKMQSLEETLSCYCSTANSLQTFDFPKKFKICFLVLIPVFTVLHFELPWP